MCIRQSPLHYYYLNGVLYLIRGANRTSSRYVEKGYPRLTNMNITYYMLS